MKQRWPAVLVLFFFVLFSYPATGGCQEAKVPGGELELLIEILKQKGILSEEEAGTLIERTREKTPAAEPAAQPAEPTPPSVFPAVSEEKEQEYLKRISDDAARQIQNNVRSQVKAELKEEIQREARAEGWYEKVPDWAKKISLGGDIRLRYQGDFFEDDNEPVFDFRDPVPPDGPIPLFNNTVDRNRYRYRLRLNLNAEINDQFQAAVRIATGNEDDPVSTNDTLGDFYNKDGIVLDRAYLRWNPILEFNAWGGRFPNPWFYTDLVWDSDLNFEGFAASYSVELSRQFRPFITAGFFPLQEVEFSSNDKYMLGGQIGTEYRPRADLIAKLGVAYYGYSNITGEFNDPSGDPNEKDYTAPLFQQKGNTLMFINIPPTEENPVPALSAYAAEFDLLNITGTFDVALFYPIHILFTADYVNNLGFDRDEVAARVEESGIDTTVSDDNEGYQVGLAVGHPSISNLWDWNVALFYKYLESDAVPDAFTDSDFHGGGTNAKGWTLSGDLGLYRNIWLRMKYLSTDEISGPQWAQDTLQIDLNGKF